MRICGRFILDKFWNAVGKGIVILVFPTDLRYNSPSEQPE